jgi:hypothetical protein
VLPINPGPAGAPCPRGRNPGRRQHRLRLREGLLPRVARMERLGPVCVGCRVPATLALPPARSDRIVGDYLRVFFGGRQSRNARRRPGHRRVPISAPRAACAPSTLGPPRRGPLARESRPLNAKSRQLATSPTPLAGLRRLGQGRAESAARYPCLSRVPPHAARLPNTSHQEDSRRFESKCYRGRSR